MSFLNSIKRAAETLYHNVTDQAQQTISKYDETQILQQTLAKAILGTAEPIETYNWVLSIENRPLFFKRVHVITDKNQIIEIFHKGRNGTAFSSSMNAFLGQVFGTENLLVCPMEKHDGLRSPVEVAFRPREVVKHFDAQVARVLHQFPNQRDFQNSVVEFVHTSLAVDLFGTDPEEEPYLDLLTYNHEKFNELMDDFFASVDKATIKQSGLLHSILNTEQFTREQKFSTITTLYQAGMHTTSNFINAFRSILLLNPTYRTRIQVEWNEFISSHALKTESLEEFIQTFKLFVLGDRNNERIAPSTWLHACYREASRLFPSVPTVARLARIDMTLGDKQISRGDGVDLDILSSNRNARVWENPEQFMPERFIDKKTGKLKTEDPILNFGMGAQGCIGKHFAKQEALIFVGLQTLLYDVCVPEEQLKNITIRLDRHHTRVELSTETSENIEEMLARNSSHPEVLSVA